MNKEESCEKKEDKKINIRDIKWLEPNEILYIKNCITKWYVETRNPEYKLSLDYTKSRYEYVVLAHNYLRAMDLLRYCAEKLAVMDSINARTAHPGKYEISTANKAKLITLINQANKIVDTHVLTLLLYNFSSRNLFLREMNYMKLKRLFDSQDSFLLVKTIICLANDCRWEYSRALPPRSYSEVGQGPSEIEREDDVESSEYLGDGLPEDSSLKESSAKSEDDDVGVEAIGTEEDGEV